VTRRKQIKEPMRSGKRLLVGLLCASVLGGAAVGALAAIGRGSATRPPATALNDSSGTLAVTPPDALDLAAAVDRWNDEAARSHGPGPGIPLIGRAKNLLSGVGTAGDTVTVFPTSRGLVCFEIKAAGSCGSLNSPSGITWAILSTRGNSRVFGVAADAVARVQVDVKGVLHDAILRHNAYHFQLPAQLDDTAVHSLLVTWTDGSQHRVSTTSSAGNR
jgi:hypothetical protein